MRKLCKLFEKGNVSVCGLKGAGKDMLFANVVMRRKNLTYLTLIMVVSIFPLHPCS